MKDNFQEQSNSKEINIEKLNILIDQGQNFLTQQLNEAVIVIGSTGSGKSVLINALVGKKLIILTNPYNPEKVAIELEDGEKGLKIGHNQAISETSVPEYIIDDKTDIGYFDCPGFGDTKSDEQDIANAIFIKTIFEKVVNVKIVVVAQQEEFTATVGRGGLIISFINQLINMFPDVDELIQSLCLVVTKVEAQFNNRTRSFSEPSLEQIINKFKEFKTLHQNSGASRIFQNENFAKIFDVFLIEDRVKIFISPTGVDGSLIDFPEGIQQMIKSIPYIQSPIINSSIAPSIKLKLEKFYVKLHQDSQEQTQELKDAITQYVSKCSNLQAVLKIKSLLLRIINLKTQFKYWNPKEIPDEIKIEYKKHRNELEELIQLKYQNIVEIMKLIDFIAVIQLPPIKMSEFLFTEIENINNEVYKVINNYKNTLVENFSRITSYIKNLINEYSQSIEDENILKNFHIQLQEALRDNTDFLKKYSQVLEKIISTQQIIEKLNELNQMYSELSYTFTIMKESDESIGSFPVDAVKNALSFSFLDIQYRLFELRQINRDKDNYLALEQCQSQFNSKLLEREKAFAQWKDEQNKIAEQMRIEREQEIDNLKTEAEKNQARLQEEMEEKNRQAEIKAQEKKEEMEKKLAEIQHNAELEAIKYEQEKKSSEEKFNLQNQQIKQMEKNLKNVKKSKKLCIIF